MASYNDLLTLLQQIDETLSTLSARLQINPQQIVLSGLADISKNMGLIQAGEFRVGNSIEPGLGFTGGRFGYPGFSYNGSLWFLAGVQDDVLKTGMSIVDGKLYAENATISGSLTAHSGFIGSWEISSTQIKSFPSGFIGIVLDSEFALIQVGDVGGTHIQIDGSNQRIRSSNFVAGASGFNISAITGDAEFNNITARGMIKTAVFEKDAVSSVGGQLLVLDSDSLAADMSALDSSTLTILGNTTFAVGDILRMKGEGSDEWLEVTNIASAPTYTVTRDKAAIYAANTNPAWKKGQAVVNYGASGSGGVELIAGANPSAIFFDHSGSPWTTIRQIIKIDETGMQFDNLADILRFKNSAGLQDNTHGTAIYGEIADDSFVIINRGQGKAVKLQARHTSTGAGIAPPLTWFEDPANADVSQLDAGLGTAGGKITMGSEVVIWAQKAGTTTVFNESGADIDFRIESDTNVAAFKLDAALETINMFGDVIIDGGADHRLEIGQDHYIPTRNASNKNIYFNEANQDMDFVVETDNSEYALYMDAALDKATSFAWDGWRYLDWLSFTRTGNHTMTVSGDYTALLRKGTKIRYTDGGTEYGVVGSSSHAAGTTTINLIPNSDYAMSGNPSSVYISHIDNPEGFPQWFNWAVSWTGLTVGNGTVEAKWRASAQIIHYQIEVVLGTTSTVGNVSFTPPVASVSVGTRQPEGYMVMLDAGTQNYYGMVMFVSPDFNLRSNDISGSHVINAVLSSTNPFTWGSTDSMFVSGWYPY